jgi:hypothetical protein
MQRESDRSMVIEAIGSLLSAVKQTSPVILLGIAIASGTIIFGQDSFVAALGLTDARNNYRAHLGIAFVLSGSILVAQFIGGVFHFLKDKRRAKRALKGLHETLHSLTPDEKAYLAPFVLTQQNTVPFPIQDGIAGGLVAKNILYRASNVGDRMMRFHHNLQPWAREYLEGHPDLLEGANMAVWDRR